MDNQLREKKLITPERASVLLPTIISSFLVLVVVSSFVIPKFVNSNKVYFELKEFKRKKNDLSNLKLQAISINKKLKKLNSEKEKIISLISGSTNLDTFLTRLGELAIDNQVNLISVIPKSLVKYVEPVENQSNDLSQTIGLDSDNLLVQGLKKNIIEVSFISSFRNLLSFLNDIEFQENVILMRDINLKPYEGEERIYKNQSEYLLEVSLQMIIYGKE